MASFVFTAAILDLRLPVARDGIGISTVGFLDLENREVVVGISILTPHSVLRVSEIGSGLRGLSCIRILICMFRLHHTYCRISLTICVVGPASGNYGSHTLNVFLFSIGGDCNSTRQITLDGIVIGSTKRVVEVSSLMNKKPSCCLDGRLTASHQSSRRSRAN